MVSTSTMRSALSVGLLVAAATVALICVSRSFRRKAAKVARVVWDGDAQGEEARSLFTTVEATIQKWSTNLMSLSRAFDDIQKDIDDACLAAEKRLETDRNQPGSTPSPTNAAAASSYYHFDSKGNKFKSKWDSFDVDAALEALDEPDDLSETFKKRKNALQKELIQAHAELWKAQDGLDCLAISDEDVRIVRKALVGRVELLMHTKDDLSSKMNSLREYPPQKV